MRVRSDLKFGTITDNPLLIGATSINSAQFSTLPIISAPDELYLTLDPEGSNREIVRVTAHASASTTCTIERGKLGTAPAQHALTTRWVHAAITTDLVVPCTSATRPTLGLWAGMRIFETDTNREYLYDGTSWLLMSSPWASFTPTLTATTTNPTMGTGGINQGQWCVNNGLVTFIAYIKFGSGMAAGSGAYRVALPTAAHADWLVASEFVELGVGRLVDSSAAVPYITFARLHDANLFGVEVITSAAGALGSWGSATPFVPAQFDHLRLEAHYRAA